MLIITGRAGLYPDREAYMGTAERGEAAVAKLHFPGLGKDGAELLVARGDRRGRDRHAVDRPRPVEELRDARGADDQRHPGLRERRRHVGAAADRRHHRRPADEDRGRLRRAAQDRRAPAGVEFNGGRNLRSQSGRAYLCERSSDETLCIRQQSLGTGCGQWIGNSPRSEFETGCPSARSHRDELQGGMCEA